MSVTTLSSTDPRLHGRLARLADAPASLRVRGTFPDLARAVAIVGTRAADEDALAFAHELGRACAAKGVVVVSGGARGIDAAAHRGALAAGGPTLAVFAGGLERPYPPEHRGLFEEVAAAGALVSELPDDTVPLKGRFLHRNRLVAAMAEAVIVVQAPARSGALSTARCAQKLGKTCFVVPHAPWIPRGEGCLQLLRGGSRVCTSASDVLQVATPLFDLPTPHDLPPEERTVFGALQKAARHVDEIAVRTGLSAAVVQRALAVLMLMGLASSPGDGRWSRP